RRVEDERSPRCRRDDRGRSERSPAVERPIHTREFGLPLYDAAMPRRHRRLVALLAVLITTVLLGSCGGNEAGKSGAPPLPGGSELLADSAKAMRGVTSTRVSINVDGDLPGVPIKSAEGQLTNEGL